MTEKQYNKLPRPERKARDTEIKSSLTDWPQYIPEWDEYAVVSNGLIIYGNSVNDCLKNKHEADEYNARNQRNLETA